MSQSLATQKHPRSSVNITPIERVGRIVVGSAAVLSAILLLVSAGWWVSVVLEALLAVAGLDLVVTGALGQCPLYRKLGFVPRSLQGQS